MATFAREYGALVRGVSRTRDRDEAMRRAVALLWDAFGEPDPARPTRGGVSWVGFYLKVPGAEEMVLVCREPKPACSPIGLHGMCGRSWRERSSIVVRDVSVLGKGYIACDPRDQSEVVVPMLDATGACAGVLDVDSYQVGAFSPADAKGMWSLLAALGLADASRAPAIVEL